MLKKDKSIKETIVIFQDITEFRYNHERINQSLDLKDGMLEVSHAITEVNNIDDLFKIILDKVTDDFEKIRFSFGVNF